MDQILVSLDLETTGLDPETDRIIEIGAVKFRGKEVLDTFQTLINPDRPVPHYVRWLTGINPEELAASPSFTEVAPKLASFLGNHPIVGQSISGDLEFLSSHGVLLSSPAYDVLELSRMLFPQLPEHNLGALAKEMGVPCPVRHRALADATTAMGVFMSLVEGISDLDVSILGAVVRLATATAWPWRSYFVEAEKAKGGGSQLSKGALAFPLSRSQEAEQWQPLVNNSITQLLDLDRLSSYLGPDGLLAKAFPAFEFRAGQVAMMQAVARALNAKQCLMVEAGTGTGKSVAYLLPALFFSWQNNAHVVVSTNTINLQEQLMSKDIPDLLRALDMIRGLRVAQLKGRGNYLCLRRWDRWYETPGLVWEEARFLFRIMVWLNQTSEGDSGEINLFAEESSLWSKISASQENCLAEECSYREGRCFLYRARRKAEGAHLIVVNHALLLSDLVNNMAILPEYHHFIIDEAHHLEEEATEQLGFAVTPRSVSGYLDRLAGDGGLLPRVDRRIRGGLLAVPRYRIIGERTGGLTDQVKALRGDASRFFGLVGDFLLYQNRGEVVEYERRVRLNREIKRQPMWSKVELSWEQLKLQIEGIEAGLSELYTALEGLDAGLTANLEGLRAELLGLRQSGGELRRQLNSVVTGSEPNQIYWGSIKAQGDVCLQAAPLRVGEELERLLFSSKQSTVLTSATLSTAGSFTFAKESLGLQEAEELLVDAPFDYFTSTLVYLPSGIPEPGKPGYQQTLEKALVELCRATRGRTLVLFTSHATLRATRTAIEAPLAAEGILVLGQGVDGSPKRLLNIFKTHPSAVLLGAASLWEGIDVVGPALSVVVITKLPFSVPTDPVFSARSQLFVDPFNEYAVPQAVLKFRQGFGRLIRSKQDRGALVALDGRLQTKSYGRVFLASLPLCTVKRGNLEQMPQAVAGWLGI